ncbi:MAG: hypothetical protein HUU35_20005 [Armatimonadetes bacterium]|nr:hypothetical protein [Armatimonadota bacterium]
MEWVYRRGSHGVRLAATRLMRGDQVVSEDRHAGWAGAGTRDNVYRINATAIDPAAEYELVGELSSHGGTDSHGEVWLLIEE